jgi:hypothetical protein
MEFLNKLQFPGSLTLNPNRIIMLALAQFVVALLSFAAPGPAPVSCAQPIEQASAQPESQSDLEATKRSIAQDDARLSRPRRAPSRSLNIYAHATTVSTHAFTALITKSLFYFSRTLLPPTHPSFFRNSPLII